MLDYCADETESGDFEGGDDEFAVDPETGELLDPDDPLESIVEGELHACQGYSADCCVSISHAILEAQSCQHPPCVFSEMSVLTVEC